jgi:hypothetical protein
MATGDLPTEQQNQALRAFVACTVAGLNPSLHAYTKPHNGAGEYEIIIGGRGMAGIIHEDIEAILRIATEYGGRAFFHVEDRTPGFLTEGVSRDGLCIVWPGRPPSGPDPEGEHDAQAAQGRRKARAEAAVTE